MLAKPKDQKQTRAEMFGEVLPELPPSERLPDLWADIGYARQGPYGAVPLDWQELRAFADLRNCAMSGAEAQCLIDMSRSYVSAVSDDNPLSIAPMERKRD